MEYKVIVVDATKVLGFDKAGRELSQEVSAHMEEGWRPQGGVCFAPGNEKR